MDVKELIKRRRGQMLVHSCIYYELNSNIVSDDVWQRWANELRDLQNNHPDQCNIGYYDMEFKDWNGDTGAMLPLKNERIWTMAKQLLRYEAQLETERTNARTRA